MADWFATVGASPPSDAPRSKSDAVDEIPFLSRRSPVLCRNGCVATSQPLASSIGLDLLRRGANAADAAVAISAALAVTEPCSCGLGGDIFCLYYDSSQRAVLAVNGSGRSPAGLTLDVLRRDCHPTNHGDGNDGSPIIDPDRFKFSSHAVTVPGAAKGWEDLIIRHGSGRFTLAELLEPAAKLAEEGFPVAPVTAHHWKQGMGQIRKWLSHEEVGQRMVPLTVDGVRGPNTGDIIHNPDLARVLRELGAKGADLGFYQGSTGRAIVEAVQRHGGTMKLDDLKSHTSTFPDPICAEYRHVKLWQVPPNGQGIAGLIALKGLNYLEQQNICPSMIPGEASCYHAMIEMMRLGFADAREYVADPEYMTVSFDKFLLDSERIEQRARTMFDPNKATIAGSPSPSSCTVSFQVVDGTGNAISFVNSNFMGFGTGIVPAGCGFTLQNRGFGFSLDPDHPNVVGPRKRPYHTIIPGMLTYADETNDLYATISNMGGNMQPQGHLQLTVDMIAGGMDPQAAIDMPRFCIADGSKDGQVCLEGGVDESILMDLKQKGHDLECNIVGHARSVFGRAQIIKRDRQSGVLWAGSDGRADGCAMGY